MCESPGKHEFHILLYLCPYQYEKVEPFLTKRNVLLTDYKKGSKITGSYDPAFLKKGVIQTRKIVKIITRSELGEGAVCFRTDNYSSMFTFTDHVPCEPILF